MPTYQIEMLWACASCKQRGNRGLARHCENCGKPKDDRDDEYFPDDLSRNNALTDPSALGLAKAGPDWKCAYCGTLQNGTGRCCAYCGADRETGEKRWQARLRAAFEAPTTGRRSETVREATVLGGRVVGPAPGSAGSADDVEVRRLRKPLPKKALLVVGALAAVLALVLFFVLRTRVVEATVTAVHWEHRVLVDRYRIWGREGWSPDAQAFDVEDRGRRVHHYEAVLDHYQTVHENYQEACGEDCVDEPPVCRTTPRRCVSNGNGTAECSGGDRECSGGGQRCTTRYCSRTRTREEPVYREEPRYQTWYAWRVWDWGHDRTVTHQGDSTETTWPGDAEIAPRAPLAAREQERNHREACYSVTFGYEDEHADVEPASLEQFRRFTLGKRFKLRIGVAHGVEVLPEGS